MYYLISKVPDGQTAGVAKDVAEAAGKLREGFDLLRRYLAGETSKDLDAARDVFRNARTECPALSDAYLYEGIALDLSEQHDEAIKRFQYLEQIRRCPAREGLIQRSRLAISKVPT